MIHHDYFVIDTFAAGPFTGSPAGVVMDAALMDDARMQSVAREINLSETVFVLGSTLPGAAVRLGSFTPTMETSAPGHAVLAGVTALIHTGRFRALLSEPGTRLPVETNAGVIQVRTEQIDPHHDSLLVWMHVPGLGLKRFSHDPVKSAGLLGLDGAAIDASMPAMKTQDQDVIVFVEGLPALMEARPDFSALAEFSRRRSIRAWCLASLETLSSSTDVHSRCFAPIAGVNEETVTVSLQGALGVYLVAAGELGMVGDQAAVTCVQSDVTGRAGLIRVLVGKGESGGYDAWIGGRCIISMTGQVHIPS